MNRLFSVSQSMQSLAEKCPKLCSHQRDMGNSYYGLSHRFPKSQIDFEFEASCSDEKFKINWFSRICLYWCQFLSYTRYRWCHPEKKLWKHCSISILIISFGFLFPVNILRLTNNSCLICFWWNRIKLSRSNGRQPAAFICLTWLRNTLTASICNWNASYDSPNFEDIKKFIMNAGYTYRLRFLSIIHFFVNFSHSLVINIRFTYNVQCMISFTRTVNFKTKFELLQVRQNTVSSILHSRTKTVRRDRKRYGLNFWPKSRQSTKFWKKLY